MISRITSSLLFALLLTSFAFTKALAADTHVYKCTQRDGAVLYTDQACRGTVLEIRLGPVDRDALARLARAQAEFDAREAQRRTQEEDALRREELNQRQQQIESEQDPDVPPTGDEYVDDAGWSGVPSYGSDGHGSFDGYRHHRRSPREHHTIIRNQRHEISPAALHHTVPARR